MKQPDPPTRSLLKRFGFYPTPLGEKSVRKARDRASCKQSICERLDQLKGGDLFAVFVVADRLLSETEKQKPPSAQRSQRRQAKSHQA